MRPDIRAVLTGSSLIVLFLFLYRGVTFIKQEKSMSIVDQNEAVEELSLDENQPDKVVVMAKTKSEDTDWVGIHLPEYDTCPMNQRCHIY